MKAIRNYETYVKLHETTWRNIPEDSQLKTRRRETLISHVLLSILRFSSLGMNNPRQARCLNDGK